MTVARPELRRLLGVAERAARAGGTVIRGKQGPVAGRVEEKAAGDYVTEIDMASERAIAMRLRGETPEIPVLAEEQGGETAERYWVVDPLDGTTNFVHGFPLVGVSVALVERNRPVVGCVHAPFQDETYTAILGGGANLARGRERSVKLSVSDRAQAQAIVATGFPFRNKHLIPRHLATLRAALERFEDLRRPGAASLDLAWVASGVFEGYFELGLSSWDLAAGALLVEEAGGVVSDWAGGDDYLAGDILAGSPTVHQALLDIAVREERAPSPAPPVASPPPPTRGMPTPPQAESPSDQQRYPAPEPVRPPIGGLAFPRDDE